MNILVEVADSDANAKQSDECVIVHQGDSTKTLWLHDYNEIYKVPGLYEQIFIDLFKGVSHSYIPSILIDQAKKHNKQARDLSVLDFGAGPGIVGDELHKHGTTKIFGIDISQEAKNATLRDRPGIYQEYWVDDLANPNPETVQAMTAAAFNCLICVSSLNVTPTAAWRNIFNAVETGGLIALNIREGALHKNPAKVFHSGSNRLIKHLIDEGILDVKVKEIYRHRVATSGKPIEYVAIVGKKIGDISEAAATEYACATW